MRELLRKLRRWALREKAQDNLRRSYERLSPRDRTLRFAEGERRALEGSDRWPSR